MLQSGFSGQAQEGKEGEKHDRHARHEQKHNATVMIEEGGASRKGD